MLFAKCHPERSEGSRFLASLGMTRFRITFFQKLFIIVAILLFPYVSYANNPYYELAAEVLERMIAKAAYKSETKILLGSWAAEREAAIQAILAKKSYDPKVVDAIRANLETPQKALLHVEGVEMGARLSTLHSKWEKLLCSLAQDEAVVRPMIMTATQLVQKELVTLTQNPAAHQNLLHYYREEIGKILEEVRTHPGRLEGLSEVEQTLARIEATFQTSMKPKEFTPGAKEVMEETLTEANLKLQRSILFLEEAMSGETLGNGVIPPIAAGGRAGVSLKTLRVVQNSTQQYIDRLRSLSQLIDGYSFSLVSARIEGIELEFLLAQIRFGTLEAQQFSFHQLVRYFNTAKQRLPTDVVKEMLANKNQQFRHYVVESYKKEGALPAPILAALDRELFKTRLFFPGEKEFAEAVETMVALISYSEETALGKALLLAEKTALERVGLVRALGHVDSHYAFSILLEVLPTLGRREDILFRACLEELVNNVKIHRGGRIQRLRDVLVPLLEADVPMQREVILALSQFPQSETVIQVVRPFLSHLDPELRAAAAVFFLDKEPHLLYELVKLLELPPQALSSEAKLLVLSKIKENISEISLLKNSLLYLAEQDSSVTVRIEALSLLAKSKEPQAAEGLLSLFNEASGSQKRKILIELLTHFEDRSTLRKTLKKIVEFYQDPRYQFDLFDVVGQEHALSQRLVSLKNDPDVLKYIYSLDTNSNPGLREFIAVVFQ
ncbi:MAG: hypothetical protein HYY62_04280 [Deltaproteobacteria bacterium]|nr:hypothetical protein [Deltaproteobacteria bacterium]